MPSFTNNTITVIGEQELATLIAGSNKMTITRVGVGSGVSGSPPLQTDLVTFQMNLTPVPPQVSANNLQQGEILVFATLDTANVGASFTWTELGVYAQIGGQSEFLLAYCQNSANDSISHQTGLSRSVYNLQIPIDIDYTQNTSITVVAGSPYYDAPVRSPHGTIAVTTPFDSAGRVIEYDIEVANQAGLVPAGIVLDFAGPSANVPAGYLICNAVQVGRAVYPNLYAAIGTIYGAGDGVTTFNLPDCRGRVTIGAGQGPGLGSYALGATLGEEYHKLTPAEMPSHAHPTTTNEQPHIHQIYDPEHYHNINGTPTGQSGNTSNVPSGATGGPASQIMAVTRYTNTGIQIEPAITGLTVTVQASGGNAVHNNIQPSIVFNKIIKY